MRLIRNGFVIFFVLSIRFFSFLFFYFLPKTPKEWELRKVIKVKIYRYHVCAVKLYNKYIIIYFI
ncbi:hypothetical protein EO95_00830 [Methanosarcina sp. 1.H.T.1A.1]|nr:hypothetical protein EO95_00830 [Methanosarcina sp. 1.H.T.1A.1]